MQTAVAADTSTPGRAQAGYRIAVVIYEDASQDLARAYRGLLAASEFADAGDEIVVLYDGSGVDTLAAASSAEHRLHRMVERLRPVTLGACGFCVRAHGVSEPIAAAGWPLLSDHKGHASLRSLVVDGYQILSF